MTSMFAEPTARETMRAVGRCEIAGKVQRLLWQNPTIIPSRAAHSTVASKHQPKAR